LYSIEKVNTFFIHGATCSGGKEYATSFSRDVAGNERWFANPVCTAYAVAILSSFV
jgi:hypothetical protein